jgi:hypothetical protein
LHLIIAIKYSWASIVDSRIRFIKIKIEFCRTTVSSLHKKLLGISGFSEVNEPLTQAKDITVENRRITPPRKSVIPPASALSDGSGYPSQVLTTAGSQGLSPHRGVTTPVQLQRVLDEFETDISGLQGIGAPAAVTSMTPSQFPSATYLQGTPTGGTYR